MVSTTQPPKVLPLAGSLPVTTNIPDQTSRISSDEKCLNENRGCSSVGGLDDAEEMEERTVHQVYEEIAGHFARTRYKPWPIVERFLHSVPSNSIGLDSGTGNGKYLPVVQGSSKDLDPVRHGNPGDSVHSAAPERGAEGGANGTGSLMIGLDRSLGLLEIARTQKPHPRNPPKQAMDLGDSVKSTGKKVKRKGRTKAAKSEEGVSLPATQTETPEDVKTPERKRQGDGNDAEPEHPLQECLRADLCFDGWRDGVFDFAISIAAIHHLSTPDRRMLSVRRLLRPLHLARPSHAHARSRQATSDSWSGSRFLLYVWAYEQGSNSKRKMGALAEDSTTASNVKVAESAHTEKIQDVMVPWVLQKQPTKVSKSASTESTTDVNGEKEDEEVPSAKVYHRYYHLFVEGELEEMVRQAAQADGFEVVSEVPSIHLPGSSAPVDRKWLRIVDQGYEKDNWWLEGEVGLFP